MAKTLGVVSRVVLRHLSSSWENSINSTYWTLYWNKSKWHLEERADGLPIPKFKSFEDQLDLLEFESPRLKKKDLYDITGGEPSAHEILRRVQLKDTSGVEARKKILEATKEYLTEILQEDLESDKLTRPGSIKSIGEAKQELRKLFPKLLSKLVWKKV
jgi:hypothetical protein